MNFFIIQIRIKTLISLFLLVFTNLVSAQNVVYDGKYGLFDNPQDGDITIEVRDYIRFLPGYSYKAETGEDLVAKINESIVCNVDYQTPIDIDTRVLSTGHEVGSLPGSINVSPTGAATYQIPITVPPGTGGMQPNLSVVYNSQSGNGLLGMKWNLSGSSAITRVSKTYYHDGIIHGVDLSNYDQFALDGNRLILFSGAQGQNGAVYRPEIDNFSKVTVQGTAGSGPSWFRVETKDGKILEYGNTSNSKIEAVGQSTVLTWLLNKVEDTHGNYMEFTYHENRPTGEFWLQSIKYTKNNGAGLSHYNEVQFFYEEREDKSLAYIDASMIQQKVLLYRIKVLHEGQLVREYKFDYSRDPGNMDIYSYLTQIREYGSEGKRFNSTIINWGETKEPYSVTPTVGLNGVLYYFGDFNGDGKTDQIHIKGEFITDGKWRMYLAGGGYYWGTLPSGFLYECITGDFDGDGKDDFYLKSRDSHFSTEYKLYKMDNNGDISYFSTKTTSGYLNYERVADFNGDGKNEVFYIADYGGEKRWGIFYEDGGPGPSFKDFPTSHGDHIYIRDFNGDRKSDIIVFNPGCKIYEVNGESLSLLHSSTYPTEDHSKYFGDFNGDGKTDILSFNPDNDEWTLRFFNGVGFITQECPITNTDDPGSTTSPNYYISDFNGDGKDDILEMIDYSDEYRKNVYYSSGVGFIKEVISIDPDGDLNWRAFLPHNQLTRDFDGDGGGDLLFYDLTNRQIFTISFHPDEKKRFVHSIANGLNSKTDIVYKPITDNSDGYYTPGTTNSYHPIPNISGALYAVSDVYTDNVNHGQTHIEYKYQGGKIHVLGKGFLGFEKVTAINHSTDIKNSTEYEFDNTYFHVSPTISKTTTAGGTPISTATFSGDIVHFGRKCIFPYIYERKIDDHLKGTSTRYGNSYDGYGNTIQDWIFYNDELGLLVMRSDYSSAGSYIPYLPQTQKTNYFKLGGGGSDSETTTWQYFSDGSVKKQVNKGITTDFTYDNFGNPLSVTHTASGADPRETTYVYDSKGRFATRITNPLEQSSESTYIGIHGGVLTTTGPNGLTTTNKYDGFGRIKESTSPEGVKTTFTYGWASGSGPADALYFTNATTPGSPDVKTYYDRLGRKLRTAATGFNGTVINSDIVYNTKRQVEKVSEPYYSGGAMQWIEYGYDPYGRKTSITQPGSRVTNMSYSGTTISTYYPDARYTNKTYDLKGNIVEIEDNGGTITYDHYANGLTQSVTYDGNTTSMEYDDYGNQTKLIDPDAGEMNYTYNAFGELLTQTDAKSNMYSMTYDKLGRMLTKSGPEGTTTWVYDTEANGIGLLSSVTGPNGISKSFKYDSYCRMNENTETIDGTPYTYSYTFDSYGNVNKETYPSGFALTYTYDNSGYLDEIKRQNLWRPVWKAEQMNAMGQYEEYLLDNDYKLRRTLEYDSYNRIKEIKTGTIQHLQYNYKPGTDNISARKDWIRSLKEDFEYDNLNRLTSSKVSGLDMKEFIYDNNGNIDTKYETGVNTDYTYGENGAGPHAVTSITNSEYNTIGYDITYTPFNKINTITNDNGDEYRFTYGPGYARKKVEIFENSSQIGAKYYVGTYEKEIIGSDTKELHYIAGGDGLAAIYVTYNGTTDTLFYILTDHLGSLHMVVDEDANVLEELSFDAWGNRRDHTNWDRLATGYSLNNYRFSRGFTGHEHMERFELINMNGRVYDPINCRFLSPDNYVQAMDFTQSYNRYSYCLNNPLVYTDPTGEFIFSAILPGIGTIIDAALWGAVINGGIYTAGVAMSDGGFDNWDWGQFGKSAAVGAISGAAGAGAGMLTQSLQVYGAVPGALIEGGIQGTAGGLAGGFGNVIMEDDWGAFGSGFAQGFATGFILGGISGGIEGYQNAQSVGANPWTGRQYINQNTYSATPKSGIPLQPNPERDCYGYALEYADDGHGNRNAAHFLSQTENAPGADPELVARSSGIHVNRVYTGRVNTASAYDGIGRQLVGGKEIIGVMSQGGQGHAVNLTRIVTADKLRIIGGGYKRVLRSTSIWDPIVGHTSGPTSFLKIITLF